MYQLNKNITITLLSFQFFSSPSFNQARERGEENKWRGRRGEGEEEKGKGWRGGEGIETILLQMF